MSKLRISICLLAFIFQGAIAQVVLQKRIAAIAAEARGRVGVAIELVETGEAVSLSGREKFPMQSVYKLPIGMAVLQAVDSGKLKLDQLIEVTTNDFVPASVHSPIRDAHPHGGQLTVSNLLVAMIAESDGSASDVFLRLLQGAPAVNRQMHHWGLTNLNIANSEMEMSQDELVQYKNWATPEGMREVLRTAHWGNGLSQSSHDVLLKIMTATSTGPHRLKGLLPAGTTVAHKTGTSGTKNGMTPATNDAGIITLPNGHHILIAVFVCDSTADEATREAVIARISKAAWDYWTTKSPP